MELLENRELLSVSQAEFSAIRTANPDLELTANMTDYNVIDITATNLSVANLKAAITTAGTTEKPDLIVCRTTASQHTMTYTSADDEILIHIDAATYGRVTIVSYGTNPLTINASQKTQVLNIEASIVAIAGLTITGGRDTSPTGGGGIYNDNGSTLTVTNCTIRENTVQERGGAIANYGALAVTNSSISGNNASNGGGIFNGGTLRVANSTINGNNAESWGGGIENFGSLSVTNCIISGNNAGDGGGIENYGTLTITNSTISGNFAYSWGGGIDNWGAGATLILYNTIVAKNTVSEGGGTDIYHNQKDDPVITGANNLIGDGTDSGLTHGVNGNIVGTTENPIDPRFVKIPPMIDTNNTGLHYNQNDWNLRLQATSPAIDIGKNAMAKYPDGSTLLYDLDGKTRIVNYIVDIGAYEYSSVATDITVQTIIRDTLTVKDGSYAEAVASHISELNEWSHFSIDVWATTSKNVDVISFNTMTLRYNSEFFFVSKVVFSEEFNGTSNTNNVSGQVTFTATVKAAMPPQTGQILLARIVLIPAPTPHNWINTTPIPSGVHFTTNTISVRSRPVGGGSETTTTPSITVKNRMVAPVPYDLFKDTNHIVNLRDFQVFIKAFGKTSAHSEWAAKYAQCDFDPNNQIDLKDFSLFIKAFGKSRANGLKNPLTPAGNDLAAVLSAAGEPPALVGGYLAPSVSEGLGDVSVESSKWSLELWETKTPLSTLHISLSALRLHPPLFQPLATFTVITADYRLHSGCYDSSQPRANDWVSESQIQSEEFYRHRFFEQLAMETESDTESFIPSTDLYEFFE